MTAYETQVGGLSPVIWFKFDETSGNAVSSGSKTPTATNNNSVTTNVTSLVSNKSVTYNGSTSTHSYTTGSTASNQLTGMTDGVFTIEFWIKKSTLGAAEQVIWNYWNRNDLDRHIAAYIRGTNVGNRGKLTYYTVRNGTGYQEHTSTAVIDDNKWHHIVVAQNGNTTKMYIDGALDSTKTDWTWTTFSWDSGTDVRAIFGAGVSNYSSGSTTLHYGGSLDEFAIYGSELSSTDVLANYNSSSKPAFGNAYSNWVATTQSSTNEWQYFYLNNGRTTATRFPNYQTSGNEVIGSEPQWDNNEDGGNYPFVQRVTTPNTNVPSGTMRTAFNSTPNLVIHPSGANDNCAAIGWQNNGPVTKNISGSITLKLGNPTGTADGIKYYVHRNLVNDTRYNLHSFGDINQNDTGTVTINFSNYEVKSEEIVYITIENDAGYVYDHTITTFDVGIAVSVTDTTGATASSTAVMPTITVQTNPNIAASPMTASALLSSNVFYGPSTQDTSYTVNIRNIISSPVNTNTSKNTGSTTISLGTVWADTGGTDRYDIVAIKPGSGFPDYNKIVKSKLSSTALTPDTSTLVGDLRVDIYVLTAAPLNSKTFDTMLYADLPAKELIATSRNVDDGSINQYYLDLTAAFADSRAATYGIVLMDASPKPTVPPGGQYDTITYNGTDLQNNLLYVLTSDLINKTVNADPATASALAVDPTISTIKNISYSASPATSTAEMTSAIFEGDYAAIQDHFEAFGAFAMPAITVVSQADLSVSASPSTASALFTSTGIAAGGVVEANPMTLSALAVMPNIVPIDNNVYAASPMTVSALMVDGTSASVLSAGILASPMLAKTFMPTPPAYLKLTDDMWYNKMYQGQASLYNERFITTSTIGDTGVNTARAFMKLFNDVTANKGPENLVGNRLLNNIPDRFVNNASDGDYTTTTTYAKSINEFIPLTGEQPVLEIGYYDDYNRKAVRFKNISFDKFTDTFELYKAVSPYSVEFSFKTTKSNQIIARGNSQSATGSSKTYGTIGLLDGKLYGMYHVFPGNNRNLTDTYVSHPDNYAFWKSRGVNTGYITGNKNVADGEWHHILIQYFDDRAQFWIDGQLDVQSFDIDNLPKVRPMVIGWNDSNTRYQSDFYTSGWSYDPGAYATQRDISLRFNAYQNYTTVQPEVILGGTAEMTQNHTTRGNRKRALYLYWDPIRFFNTEQRNPFDRMTDPLAGQVSTIDRVNQPPAQWYEYDIFPIDITGKYVSDLVKVEAYGGSQNIILGTAPTQVTTSSPVYDTLVNRRGAFRDATTDAARYINLTEDVNLEDFDIILFQAFPDETLERDRFTRSEVVDSYFGLIEKDIYEKFIKDLRSAVDTGISLYVTNPQLAVDLGIIDRYEVVSQFNFDNLHRSDAYAATIVDGTWDVGGSSYLTDASKNNKFRVLNTLPDLTDWPSWIWENHVVYHKDNVYFQDFLGFDRKWDTVSWKENGLEVGDEFLIYGTTNWAGYTTNEKDIYAIPAANVKAGVAVTGLGQQYIQDNGTYVDNPYANYVTTIAIRPGDTLNGTQCGGKIFVNFVETAYSMNEYDHAIELLTDARINFAYSGGLITSAERDQLLADSANYDRKLEANSITEEYYNNRLAIWSYNGNNDQIQGYFQIDNSVPIGVDFTSPAAPVGKSGAGVKARISSAGTIGSGTFRYNQLPFGNLRSGTKYKYIAAYVPSMFTRGLWWLSGRTFDEGTVNRETPMASSARMVMPAIVTDKITTQNVTPMVANATIGEAGYKDSRNNIATPMEASALMNGIATNIQANPMLVSAETGQNYRVYTLQIDQVVVYIEHEDPILYVREDIIK